jgi:hypothetical protein
MTLRRTVLALVAGAATIGLVASAVAASMTVTSKQLTAASVPVTLTTVTLTAVADTYANQGAPTSNFATSTTLNVRSATSGNRRSFVRFDLSAIPTSARVQAATLQMTMSTAPTASRTYEADKVSASWVETTLTWNLQPAAGAATASVASGTTSNVVLSWNVKADAAAFVTTPASNFGWRIKDVTESSATARLAVFRSREFTSGRPTLVVVYAT